MHQFKGYLTIFKSNLMRSAFSFSIMEACLAGDLLNETVNKAGTKIETVERDGTKVRLLEQNRDRFCFKSGASAVSGETVSKNGPRSKRVF